MKKVSKATLELAKELSALLTPKQPTPTSSIPMKSPSSVPFQSDGKMVRFVFTGVYFCRILLAVSRTAILQKLQLWSGNLTCHCLDTNKNKTISIQKYFRKIGYRLMYKNISPIHYLQKCL